VTDSSNREQVIVCFRWVDNAFEPHEDFMGLCSVADITAQSIFQVVKDACGDANESKHEYVLCSVL